MHIQVKGNVGQEPELKFSKNNMAYVTLSVAYTPRTKQNDVWSDGETMWFRVVQFGTKAEATVDLIKKGDSVIVTGDLKQSTYTDKEGKEKTSLEITADNIGLLPRMAKANRQNTEATNEGLNPWA
jgi:single-strand DNA-binding protein